jgi:hypothetical protein
VGGFCVHCRETRDGDAAFCPACGTRLSHPPGETPAELPRWEPPAEWDAPVKPSRFSFSQMSTFTKIRYAIGVTVLLIAGGVWLYEHQGVQADGDSLEATIVERFQPIIPGATLYATCPDRVLLHKGRIVDCTIERSDNGKSTQVFVTPIDNGGHFQMQVADTSVLVNLP